MLCHRNTSMQDLNICKNAFRQFTDLQIQNPNNNFLNDSNSEKHLIKENCPEEVISTLNDIKIKNVNKLIIDNLNINSYARKIYQFKTIKQNKLDIVVITEIKLDNSYPPSQFSIDGFSKAYMFDRNKNGGGILIFIRADITRKQSKYNFTKEIECIFFQINFSKKSGSFSGHTILQTIQIKFEQLDITLGTYNNYDNFLLVSDVNAEDSDC